MSGSIRPRIQLIRYSRYGPTRPKSFGSDETGSTTPLKWRSTYCHSVYLRRGPGWDEGVDDRLGWVGAHHTQASRHHVGESLPGLRGVLVPARRVLGRRPPDNSKENYPKMLYPTVLVPVPVPVPRSCFLSYTAESSHHLGFCYGKALLS